MQLLESQELVALVVSLHKRLVRLGVRNLKLADPDTFDVSNMNRQWERI